MRVYLFLISILNPLFLRNLRSEAFGTGVFPSLPIELIALMNDFLTERLCKITCPTRDDEGNPLSGISLP